VTIGGLNSSAAGSLVNLADGVTLTLNGTSASGLGTIRMGAGSTTASTTLQAASTSISQMGLEITGSPGSSTTTIAGSNSITLSGSNTFIGTSASTRKLTVTNTGGTTLSGTTLLTNSGGAARTIQFETGSNASLTLSGQVTQTSGVAGTLQKLGTGTLVLSNSANSFSGGLNIDAGTVESQAQGALGAGTVTVGTSGTLRISTADQSLTIGGSGLNLALSGSNSTLDVTAGRKLTLSRSTSGATSFTKTGAGTLELGGANSYSLTSGGSTNVAIVEGSVLMNRSGGSSTFGDATSTPNITIGTAGTVTSATLKAEAATDPFAGKPNLTINHLGTLDLNGRSATATSITMNGGTIQTGAGTISLGTVAGTNLQYTGTTQTATISGFMTLGGVAQTISVANGAAAVDLDITAGINAGGGTGSMLKTGSGTLRLTGNNGYSGGTTVSQGTLLVNNTTGSGTGSGTVDVSSGATLGGTGKINGAVNVTGVLAPGASIESLGSGTLSFSNGSAFNYEINTSTVAADLQFVTGGLNLAGTVTLNLTDLGSLAALTLGTKFTLISYTGTWDGDVFSGYADESTFNFANNQWRINYNDTTGGANFSSDQTGANGFVTMTVIPEPRAALLGGLGLLALLRRRRA
jgi:autotransporter-associated beta strand protein